MSIFLFVDQSGKKEFRAFFRRLLRVSVWNSALTAGNHVLGEVDIVLSQIDWSKENARDYVFSSIEA
jgi:hypothetical protein